MTTVLQHLAHRHLDTDLHQVWVNESERIATMPLWNLAGQMTGYHQYRPDANKTRHNDPKMGRYFTWRRKDMVTVWGAESMHRPGPLFVTEGVFDAARLTQVGAAAVAVLSNSPTSDTRQWLASLGRLVVCVCDNDKAGLRLAKYGDVAEIMPHGQDLGDVCQDVVTELLDRYKIHQ